MKVTGSSCGKSALDGSPDSRRIVAFAVRVQTLDHGAIVRAIPPRRGSRYVLLLHLGADRKDKLFPLLDSLITELERHGYQFVRIDGMLGKTKAHGIPHA